MIIYKTTNLISGKIYIGQDSHNNPKYLGSGSLLNEKIKFYGRKNFKKEILEYCETAEQLNEREIFWIEYFSSRNLKIGYNISKGGQGSWETGFRNPFFGKTHSDKFKKYKSLQMKELMKGEGNSMFGKKHSEEAKKKMSERKKGLYYGEKNPRAKKIYQYDLSMNFLEEFNTTKECADKYNLSRGNISSTISYNMKHLTTDNKRKQVKGFYFFFEKI